MENLKKIIEAKYAETQNIEKTQGFVYFMALESAEVLGKENKEFLDKLGIDEGSLFLEVTGYVQNNTIMEKINECMKDLGIIKEAAETEVETPAETVVETSDEPEVETPDEPEVETPDEPEVETPDEPVATDKAQKLENKINNLIEKFEKETNPIKRQIYTARIAWLSDKFANALKIQQIKEEFDGRRTVQKAENFGKQTKQKIGKASLEVQIAELKEQISDENKKLQPRFDPESPKFIFRNELARHENDLEKLLAEIEKAEDGHILAQKIRDTVAAKEEAGVPDLKSKLGELEKKLAEEKGATIGRRFEEFNSMRKLGTEEKSLVSTEKKGILTRIADWGKALKAKWDDRKKEKEQIDAIKAEGVELLGMYKKDVERTAQENATRIAELKAEIAKLEAETRAARASVDAFAKNDIATGDKKRINKAVEQNREARAEKFRTDLAGIRQDTKVDFTPKAGATQETHVVDESVQEEDEQDL